LVNNAGYPFDREIWYKRFHEVTDEAQEKIIEVDLKGSMRLSKTVIHSMLQSSLKTNGGVIINISSPAIAGHVEGSPYTITKAGLSLATLTGFRTSVHYLKQYFAAYRFYLLKGQICFLHLRTAYFMRNIHHQDEVCCIPEVYFLISRGQSEM